MSWAAQIAAEFGAHLTLAHVTASVELWGPGGSYVNPKWKKELVSDASQQLIELREDLSIKADLFVGSGNEPKILGQAAKQTKADLLVLRVLPLWREPADPRLRNHLRGADSGSERVTAVTPSQFGHFAERGKWRHDCELAPFS